MRIRRGLLHSHRRSIVPLLASFVAACAAPVRVGVAPPVPIAASISVMNELGLPVNVYILVGDATELLGQVPANSTKSLPVRLKLGTLVRIRATRADGSTSYTKAEFALPPETSWRVP